MIRKGRRRVKEDAKGEDFCPRQTMLLNIEPAWWHFRIRWKKQTHAPSCANSGIDIYCDVKLRESSVNNMQS